MLPNTGDLKSIILSQRLAQQSAKKLGEDGVLAAVLGIEAFKASDTMAARRNLFRLQKEAGYPAHMLAGHGSSANGVAFSLDGKLVASVSCKEANADGECTLGEIFVWDAVTETRLRELTGHGGKALCVAFSPDGKLLATGGSDGTILLWDVLAVLLSGQTPPTELKGHKGRVRTLAFSLDGKLLASAGDGERILLWDTIEKKTVGEFMSQAPGIECVAFSPDGKMLASGGWDLVVKLWDLAAAPKPNEATEPNESDEAGGNGDASGGDKASPIPAGLVAVLHGHGGVVLSLAYSRDGKTLVSGSWDHRVRLWDVSERTAGPRVFPCRAILTDHTDAVASVAFHPDGAKLATGSWDHRVALWNVETGEQLGQLNRHRGAVTSVAFSQDGMTLASACVDGMIGLWRIRPRALAALGEASLINALAFSPVNTLLAVTDGEANIFLWDSALEQTTGTEEKVPIAKLTGHLSTVQSLGFRGDGIMLASGDQAGTLMLWDMSDTKATRDTTVRPVAMVTGISENVWSVQFSPDGKSVVTGDNAGKLRFWDVETLLKVGVPEDFDFEVLSQEPMSQVQAHSNALETLVFSPDGKRLATGGADGKILLWDAATVMNAGATPLNELRSLEGVIHAVVFSPDGKMIAAAGDDKPIVVWDAVSSQEIFRLHGHTNGVSCLAFSPDSRMLASGGIAKTPGGTDTTLRLWDVVEEQLIGGFEEHPSDVLTLAFRRDGNVLASGGSNSKTLLWDMDANSWSARVCECVDRNLTRREYARYIDSEPAAYDTKYAKEPTCSDLPVEK